MATKVVTRAEVPAEGGSSRQTYFLFQNGKPAFSVSVVKQGSAGVQTDFSNVRLIGTDHPLPKSGWYRVKARDFFSRYGRVIDIGSKFTPIDPTEEADRLEGKKAKLYNVRDPGVGGRQRIEDIVQASQLATAQAQRAVAEVLRSQAATGGLRGLW